MKNLSFLLLFLCAASMTFAQQGYIEDAMYDKYGKEHAAKGESWVKNMMSAKVAPQYKFSSMMQFRMTTYKKGKVKDASDMSFYMNPGGRQVAMRAAEAGKKEKGEDMLMIYDYDENAVIILQEQEKTGVAMNMNMFMRSNAGGRTSAKAEHNNTSDCKKTGRTKTIQGYECQEYVCTNTSDNTRSEIWITDKVKFDFSTMGGKNAFAPYLANSKGLGGMLMEGNFYKNDELETKMEVARYNPNENMVVKTTDYEFGM